MTRSIWKGSITFGMVNIPSKLYSATDDLKVSLHLYHGECGSRIKMQRFCPNCQKMLEATQIVKGYELGDRYVPLTEQDLQSLPLKSLKTIEVVEFVDPAHIDIRAYADSYFLVADETGHLAYTLFLLAMEKANVVAVTKLGYREREHLAVVRPYNRVMLLQTLRYADELRSYDEFQPPQCPISERDIELALTLIKAMTVPQFDHAKYKDEYRQALERLIEAKIAGEILPKAEEAPAPVSDVAEALLASLKLVGSKGD